MNETRWYLCVYCWCSRTSSLYLSVGLYLIMIKKIASRQVDCSLTTEFLRNDLMLCQWVLPFFLSGVVVSMAVFDTVPSMLI